MKSETAVGCMEVEMDREYYWKRTPGWDWFGTPRWWEVFIVPLGFNGAGGLWLKERWRWNGSDENIREEIRTLSAGETLALLSQIDDERKAIR